MSNDFKYVNFCKTVVGSGFLIEKDRLGDAVRRALEHDANAPLFRTVQLYDESAKKYFDDHGESLKGYSGTTWSDIVPIDIDCERDPVVSLRITKALTKALLQCDVLDTEFRVAFSGKKGFHIVIPQPILGFPPSQQLGKQMNAFVENFVKSADIPEDLAGEQIFDPAMYSARRLFRIAGSRHQDTGLMKVYVPVAAILDENMDYIMAVAKGGEDECNEYIRPTESNTALRNFWPTAESEKLKRQAKISLPVKYEGPGASGAEGEFRPDQRVCMQRILNMSMGPNSGRNETAIRLASHYAGLGTPSAIVDQIMTTWNDANSAPLPQHEIKEIVRKALAHNYYFGCDDVILKKHCTTNCFKYSGFVEAIQAESGGEKLIKAAPDMAMEYKRVMTENRFITTGIPELDSYVRGVAPGEVIGIIARTAVGKTTVAMFMMMQIAIATGKHVLMLQQELGDTLIWERMAAMITKVDGPALEAVFRRCQAKADMTEYEALETATCAALDKIHHCTLSSLSTARKVEIIKKFQEQYGKENIACVFEDYLGLGEEAGRSTYESVSRLAKGVKRGVAKVCDVPYFVLTQVARGEKEDGSTPLTMHSARDSGAIEESMDVMIGVSRPGYGKLTGDDHMLFQILKSRRGGAGNEFKLKWHKRYGLFESYLGGPPQQSFYEPRDRE